MKPLDGSEEKGGNAMTVEENIRGKSRKSYKMDEVAAST